MSKKTFRIDNPIGHTLEQQAVSVHYEEFVKENPKGSPDYALRFGWYLAENWWRYQEDCQGNQRTLGVM